MSSLVMIWRIGWTTGENDVPAVHNMVYSADLFRTKLSQPTKNENEHNLSRFTVVFCHYQAI